jgi:hypothetical protein
MTQLGRNLQLSHGVIDDLQKYTYLSKYPMTLDFEWGVGILRRMVYEMVPIQSSRVIIYT